jgi:MFS family permease
MPSHAADAAADAALRRRRVTLGALAAAMALNFLDRQLLATMMEPIKHELLLSDAQLGFLSGGAFSICNAFVGLAMGYAADRYNRKRVLVTSMVLWCGFTAAQALAHSYWSLLAMRVLVGVGEAGGGPASHSIICDLFPLQARGLALSVYAAAIPGGILLGLLLGGWLTQVRPCCGAGRLPRVAQITRLNRTLLSMARCGAWRWPVTRELSPRYFRRSSSAGARRSWPSGCRASPSRSPPPFLSSSHRAGSAIEPRRLSPGGWAPSRRRPRCWSRQRAPPRRAPL